MGKKMLRLLSGMAALINIDFLIISSSSFSSYPIRLMTALLINLPFSEEHQQFNDDTQELDFRLIQPFPLL